MIGKSPIVSRMDLTSSTVTRLFWSFSVTMIALESWLIAFCAASLIGIFGTP